ncbi:hypothetical protein OHB39_36795 [Streptomyces sp. NBC_00047]|uniref:hypothetical protein n=1 Tax=Streptomyces sp. NBC_00047 TaxID=2975627 RepID=UPI0022510E88|nr:hypothetical protein [Streptomyces sp. NBC_00047]MCX5613062.1 hypothetical protein [Streptomyces sp. NBC_00047]
MAGHLAADVAEAVGELVVDGFAVELLFEALDTLLRDGDIRLQPLEVAGCRLWC